MVLLREHMLMKGKGNSNNILYEDTIKLKNDLVRFDQFNDIVELSKYSKLEKKYSK